MTHPRILIVDEEAAVRRMLVRFLSAKGFEVSEAASGDQAMIRARENRQDLVVLDIETPGLSGVDGCRNMRDCAQAPVIVMSAPTADNELVAYEAGADGFFAKPFELCELLGCIDLLMRKSSRTAERSGVIAH